MTISINEQDQAVAKYLKEIDITYSVRLMDTEIKEKGENWEHDLWRVKFGDFSTTFKTGTGHRVVKINPAMHPKNLQALCTLTGANVNQVHQITRGTVQLKGSKLARDTRHTYTAPPTQASVLYCLLSDADALDYSFDEWCDNLGYDSDSIKANSMYEACREIARNLDDVFTPEQIEKLQELLQDY